MPYLYKNADHMWAVLDGKIGQDMLAQIESSGSGLVGLCWYDSRRAQLLHHQAGLFRG